MNVKLLRKVAKHILAEPKRFFMDNAVETGKPGDKVALDGEMRSLPKCGTAACIAGWACILSRVPIDDVSMSNAERLLKISSMQSSDLFLADYWPSPFYGKWREAKTLRSRARIAANRIEHFIKTGE